MKSTDLIFKKRNLKLLNDDEQSSSLFDYLLLFIIIFMLSVLLFVCFFQMCEVLGTSMTNTLKENDHILITNYDVNYKNGDIIVLDVADEHGSIRLIKRVIATEDEQFYFKVSGGYVELYKKNKSGIFEKIDEPFIKEPMMMSSLFGKYFNYYDEFDKENTIYTVPKNSIFFLGDNRNDSRDSRYYGFCDEQKIIGKMVYKLKPNTFSYYFLRLIFS